MLKKIAVIIVVSLIVIAALTFTFKDAIVKSLIENNLSNTINAAIKVEKVRVGLLNGSVALEGVTVHNPPPFSDTVFAKSSRIYVVVNPFVLLKGGIEIKELELLIDEINVIKKSGKTNLGYFNIDAFKKASSSVESSQGGSAQEGISSDTAQKIKDIRAPAPARLHIQNLHLAVNQVHYINQSKEPPEKKDISLGIDKVYKDVYDINKIFTPLLFEIAVKAAIGQAVSVEFKDVEIKTKDALETVKNTIESVVTKGKEALKEELPFIAESSTPQEQPSEPASTESSPQEPAPQEEGAEVTP